MHSDAHSGTVSRLLAASLVVVALSPAPALSQEQLVVLSRTGSQATLVDPNTQEVLVRLPAGSSASELALSPDGRFAYVPNQSGHASMTEPGTVTVLDLVERRVETVYQPEGYRGLRDVTVGANGRRMWLTSEADSGIVELDVATGTVLMLWKTGAAKSHRVVITPDLRKLYVANGASDSVTVINRQTVVAKRIPAGLHPEDLDVAPNGRAIWVANRGDHTVSVIHAGRDRLVASLQSGGREPVRVRFRPDGYEVWVANYASSTLTIFDRYTQTLTDTIELEAGPWDILFSPDGRRAFVSAPDQNLVYVIDVATREVTESFYAGPNPTSLAWASNGHNSKGLQAR
jgi:YVTN family beta-propeller protein